jgi:hypothetical protein
VARLAVCLLLSIVVSGCSEPEDPARVELRARVRQGATLSEQDLGRVLDEVSRSIAGKRVRISENALTRELEPQQRDVVFGMLTERVGVYDEGLRASGTTVRVINAPGISLHSEYSAARRLLVDVDTFLPRRFEFNHEFPMTGDYAFDLLVE